MQRVLHGAQLGRRADVIPLAIVAQAPEAAILLRLVVESVQGEGPLGRALKEARMEDLDAGVDEGRDLPLLPAAQTADGVHQVIPDALVAEGAAGRVQQQQRVHILVVPGGGQALQRRRQAVEPADVAVEDEEGVGAELRQRLRHPAAGLQKLRSDDHTSDLQSLMRISYAVISLQKNNTT